MRYCTLRGAAAVLRCIETMFTRIRRSGIARGSVKRACGLSRTGLVVLFVSVSPFVALQTLTSSTVQHSHDLSVTGNIEHLGLTAQVELFNKHLASIETGTSLSWAYEIAWK